MHRPFIYIAVSFSLGILLNRVIQFSFSGLCLLIVVALALGARFSKRRFFPTIFLLLAIAGLGAVCMQGRQYVPGDDIMHVAKYYRKNPMTVEGIIVSDVEEREAVNGSKTTFLLDVQRVQAPWGWQERSGKILVNAFGWRPLSYGDRIIAQGKLHRPYDFSPGTNFSYRDYLARRNIRFILSVKKDISIRIREHGHGNYLKALSLKLRDHLKNILLQNLSANESGIMRAILLGDRSAVPKLIRALFVQTGTAHILAISGLHMGIVAALFLLGVKMIPVGRRWQLAAVIMMTAGYAFLTGSRPSVVRAAVMTSVFLASFIVEKEFDMLNALCLAAAVILLANPFALFDAGFQLSFCCVFAIIYADSSMKTIGIRKPGKKKGSLDKAYSDTWGRFILQPFYLSLVIWISVAGLIAYHFGIVTPVTILANVIVIPLISVIVALGFGLLLTGLIFPAGAFMFALCLKVVLNVMVGLIFLLDKAPFAYIHIIREVSVWHVTAYYSALFSAVIISQWYFSRANREYPPQHPVLS